MEIIWENIHSFLCLFENRSDLIWGYVGSLSNLFLVWWSLEGFIKVRKVMLMVTDYYSKRILLRPALQQRHIGWRPERSGTNLQLSSPRGVPRTELNSPSNNAWRHMKSNHVCHPGKFTQILVFRVSTGEHAAPTWLSSAAQTPTPPGVKLMTQSLRHSP